MRDWSGMEGCALSLEEVMERDARGERIAEIYRQCRQQNKPNDTGRRKRKDERYSTRERIPAARA